MRKGLMAALMAAGMGAGVAAPADALVVVLTSTAADTAGTRFNYDVTLSPDEGYNAASVFAIFDFAGYVTGSATSLPGFTFSYENSSGLPGLDDTDDAAIGNLVFRSTGVSSPGTLSFSAVSTLGGMRSDGFSSRTVKTDGMLAGTTVASQGSVGVPAVAAVPEPAAWAMMGLGFGLVGFAARARRTGRIARVFA